MIRKIVISTLRTETTGNHIVVDLQGGSPWFGYIWVNDIQFTIYQTPRGYKFVKTKL